MVCLTSAETSGACRTDFRNLREFDTLSPARDSARRRKYDSRRCQNELDLESVAVHEIGHLLGLHHEENVQEAIMYPYFEYGIIKRDLHEDDIRGIRALYGLNN